MDWVTLLTNKSVDEMVNIFYDSLYSLFNMFMPKKKNSTREFPLLVLTSAEGLNNQEEKPE